MARRPTPRKNENGNQHERGGGVPILDSNRFILICEEYARTGLAYASCEALGVNYNTVMSAIKSKSNEGDDSWQETWDEARDKFRESLEKAIIERGRDGTPTKWSVNPKTGERTPIEWTYSDRLLELAAKGHFPERYRDKVFVSGNVGLEPIDVFSNLTLKAKREIRAIIMRDLEEQRQSAQAARITDQSQNVLEADFTELGEEPEGDS